jgi:signal transduction histidine kinase
MRLVTKIRTGIIAGFIMLILVTTFISNYYTLRSAVKVDNVNSIRASAALENIINESIQQLIIKDSDWGAWDDTYAFVQDRNTDYIQSNVQQETVNDLEIQFLIISNLSGDAAASIAVDPDTRQEAELWPDVSEYFSKHNYFHEHADEEDKRSGILMTSKGPAIIVSVPITPTQGGDIKGSVIMGKVITPSLIEDWSASVGYPIGYHVSGDPNLADDFRQAQIEINSNEKIFLRTEGDNLFLYMNILDMDLRPAITLRMELPRNVYVAGKNTTRLVASTSIIFSIILLVFFFIYFERAVLSRVISLIGEINSISQMPGTQNRITVSGNDELSAFAKSLNSLLDSNSAYNIKLEQDESKLKEWAAEQERTKAAIMNIMEDLTESMENQKRLEKVKTEFLSVTSHELRTPITPMRAQLQMILAGYFGNITEEQKKSLNVILNNTTSLDRLIGDILDISKLQSGVMKFVASNAELAEIARNAVDTMKPKTDEHKISLTLTAQKIPRMMLDKERILQVFINFINNAIKFTDPGGQITVRVEAGKEEARATVTDTGIGIDKKDIARIFAPFEQVDASYSRNHEGTGLGLAICKGIIIQHGGRIWVESEPGKGSSFIFTLPYHPKQAPGNADIELFHVGNDYIVKKEEKSTGILLQDESAAHRRNKNKQKIKGRQQK